MASRWYVLLAVLLIGAGGGFLGYKSEEPTYASSAQLFVSSSDQATVVDAFQGNALAQQQALSYSELITGQQVLSRVALELGLNTPPSALAGQVAISIPPASVVITIAAQANTGAGAAALANSVAANGMNYIRELQTPEGADPSVIRITQTAFAEQPTTPIAPNLQRYLALGGGAGLVVGIAIAVLWFRLDNKVSSSRDAASTLSTRSLGDIPKERKLGKTSLTDFRGGGSSAEAFRKLRTSLQYLARETDSVAWVFTSPGSGDGTTTVALNVSRALARSGENVVFVEANLRDPKLSSLFGFDPEPGLSNILGQGAYWQECVRTVGDEHLAVIPAGYVPADPNELLSSDRMSLLVDDLRSKYKYIVFDSPQATSFADSAVVASVADGVVVVVALRAASAKDVAELETSLPGVVGVVGNFAASVASSSTAAPSEPTVRRGSHALDHDAETATVPNDAAAQPEQMPYGRGNTPRP